jgi:hypothetical protein
MPGKCPGGEIFKRARYAISRFGCGRVTWKSLRATMAFPHQYGPDGKPSDMEALHELVKKMLTNSGAYWVCRAAP